MIENIVKVIKKRYFISNLFIIFRITFYIKIYYKSKIKYLHGSYSYIWELSKWICDKIDVLFAYNYVTLLLFLLKNDYILIKANLLKTLYWENKRY